MNDRPSIAFLIMLGAALLSPTAARAHCDGMDGPVVKAAQEALAEGNVDLVLVWVRPVDEEEIRDAFSRTLSVRRLNEEARDLADGYFFETLVRIHRAGEGAPFTGLKPAGRDLGPAIPLADEALATGKIDALVGLITHQAHHGLTERFDRARSLREYPPSDVQAGRDYVEAYVTYIHYAERLYEAASRPVSGHFPEHEAAPEAHEP